jgi:MoxR-like ATPase
MATQNPLEQEGTYPLPEAQLDRFFYKLLVKYSGREELKKILDFMRAHESFGSLEEAAVKRAIELSEQKYCSVSAMLQKTATLTWRHEILPPEK